MESWRTGVPPLLVFGMQEAASIVSTLSKPFIHLAQSCQQGLGALAFWVSARVPSWFYLDLADVLQSKHSPGLTLKPEEMVCVQGGHLAQSL